jgi:anti-anti-sigma factor
VSRNTLRSEEGIRIEVERRRAQQRYLTSDLLDSPSDRGVDMPPRFTAALPPESGIVFRLSYTLDSAGTGTPRIFLAGELSLTTADHARTVIQRAQGEAGRLICDLTDVTFMDVSGACILLDLATRARDAGGHFTIANPPSIVPRILRIFGLEHSLEIDEHPVEAALPSVALGAPIRADVCNASPRLHAGHRVSARRRRRPCI